MAEREVDERNEKTRAKVRAAAKHLHVRGFFGVNMAELDEAVRLALGQGHCDPFESPGQSLLDEFGSKDALFVMFLEGLLDEAMKNAFDLILQKSQQQKSQQTAPFDPIHEVLNAAVTNTLRQFQTFRYLIAGAVSEGLSMRRVDPYLLAETRRVVHIFFAGLLGLWEQEDGLTLTDGDVFWFGKKYDDAHRPAVELIRRHLDRPLTDLFLVEGLYVIYSGATLWWLTARSHRPEEPTAAIDDLSVLVAGLIRRSNGPAAAGDRDLNEDCGDSLLRRALKIEQRLRKIHFAESLHRFLPMKQFEELGRRLLRIAYAQVPRRIALVNGLQSRHE